MDLKFRKREILGKKYFSTFCSKLPIEDFIELGPPNFDFDNVDLILDSVKDLKWFSDGKNVASLCNFPSVIKYEYEELRSINVQSNKLLCVPAAIGRYTGLLSVRSNAIYKHIPLMCQADGEGLIFVSEANEISSIFSYHRENETIAFYIPN